MSLSSLALIATLSSPAQAQEWEAPVRRAPISQAAMEAAPTDDEYATKMAVHDWLKEVEVTDEGADLFDYVPKDENSGVEVGHILRKSSQTLGKQKGSAIDICYGTDPKKALDPGQITAQGFFVSEGIDTQARIERSPIHEALSSVPGQNNFEKNENGGHRVCFTLPDGIDEYRGDSFNVTLNHRGAPVDWLTIDISLAGILQSERFENPDRAPWDVFISARENTLTLTEDSPDRPTVCAGTKIDGENQFYRVPTISDPDSVKDSFNQIGADGFSYDYELLYPLSPSAYLIIDAGGNTSGVFTSKFDGERIVLSKEDPSKATLMKPTCEALIR